MDLQSAALDPMMNQNLNDPNKKIIVRLCSTGSLVAIDRMEDFKPGYHMMLEAKSEPAPVNPLDSLEKSSTVAETVLEPKLDVDSQTQTAVNVDVSADEARFEELKELRGWQKADLKDEYNALKEKLNK